jgi:hypothetical protein
MSAESTQSIVASAQSEQVGLISLLDGPIDAAWSLLDPNDPSTMTDFLVAVQSVVSKYGLISGVRAASFYTSMRQASGIPGSYIVKSAPVVADKVDASTRWAVSGLWQPSETGIVGAPDVEALQGKAKGPALTNLQAVTEKNVLDIGRNTILDAIKSDRKARGWAREVGPGACSFCAMLATRGAVYKSEETASFEAHDHCHCIAVPTFTAYEPTAQVREWQQLYKESTKGVRGSANMRNAFRQAYESKYGTK